MGMWRKRRRNLRRSKVRRLTATVSAFPEQFPCTMVFFQSVTRGTDKTCSLFDGTSTQSKLTQIRSAAYKTWNQKLKYLSWNQTCCNTATSSLTRTRGSQWQPTVLGRGEY